MVNKLVLNQILLYFIFEYTPVNWLFLFSLTDYFASQKSYSKSGINFSFGIIYHIVMLNDMISSTKI